MLDAGLPVILMLSPSAAASAVEPSLPITGTLPLILQRCFLPLGAMKYGGCPGVKRAVSQEWMDGPHVRDTNFSLLDTTQRLSELQRQDTQGATFGRHGSLRAGHHITIDHIITRDLKDHGLDGERVALVIKDVYSKFRYIYPAEAQDTDSCINSFKHCLKVEDKIDTIYSDNAPELIAAARSLKASLVASRVYINEKKSVIERERQFLKAHVPILSRLVLV